PAVRGVRRGGRRAREGAGHAGRAAPAGLDAQGAPGFGEGAGGLMAAGPEHGASLAEVYGGRVRVRVGALVFDEAGASVLLVEHAGRGADRPFWTPPGGGVDFGEPLHAALRREVEEETGLA